MTRGKHEQVATRRIGGEEFVERLRNDGKRAFGQFGPLAAKLLDGGGQFGTLGNDDRQGDIGAGGRIGRDRIGLVAAPRKATQEPPGQQELRDRSTTRREN